MFKKFSALLFLWIGFSLTSMPAANATSMPCRLLQPQDYLVFSLSNIRAENSDFQGVTGAVGAAGMHGYQISAQSPDLCSSLVVGENLVFSYGEIMGDAEIGTTLNFDNAQATGTAFHGDSIFPSNYYGRHVHSVGRNLANLNSSAQFFIDQSAMIFRQTTNASAVAANGYLTLTANDSGESVFSITAEQLNAAGVLTIHGNSSVHVYVNIVGETAALTDKDVQLVGGIGAGQVILNFAQAKSLHIEHAGNTNGGIRATILAPYANVEFRSALITGGLYVGCLLDENGQVNFAPTPWAQDSSNGGDCGCHNPINPGEGQQQAPTSKVIASKI